MLWRQSLIFTPIQAKLQPKRASCPIAIAVVRNMSNTLKASFVAVLLLGTALFSPAQAQTAEELASRLNQMEEQMRLLVGQVEELTYSMKQLQGQLKNGTKTGAAEEPPKLKKAAQQPVAVGATRGGGAGR